MKEQISESIPYPPPTVETDTALPFCQFRNYRFHCRVYGEGRRESVLVLHGGPGGDFRYLLPLRELSQQYRLIFYDQRGSGLSARQQPGMLQLDQYLEDLHAFVQHYSHSGPLSLFGHSWGAYLALQYVARYPGRVQKLMLAAPFIPDIRTRASMLWHNLQNGIIAKLLRAKIKSMKIPATDEQARRDYFFGILLKQSNPGYNCPGKDTRVPMWRSGYYAFQKLSSAAKKGEKLEQLGFPPEKILILAGACDKLLGMAYQERVQKKLGGPQLRQIPDAGHYLLQDNAEACLKEVEGFLKAGG